MPEAMVTLNDLLSGLKAAAEPTRLRLLALCARADLTVSELTHILGQSQPRVSRHLKLLCEAGLVERSREGAWAFYRLSRRGPAAEVAQRLLDMLPEEDESLALDRERLDAVALVRAEAAADYFRRNATDWDRIRAMHVPEAEVEDALMGLVPEHSDEILDIGTGTGRVMELLASRCDHAVGLDMSREMLTVARARLEKSEVRNWTLRHGDLFQLPWPAESFDLVVVHQVLHYVDQPERGIAEAARVLRPGGRLIVVDFAPHEEESLRVDHAHRHLGLEDGDMAEWCRNAGLTYGEVRHLEGDPLTVNLWTAQRAGASSEAQTERKSA